MKHAIKLETARWERPPSHLTAVRKKNAGWTSYLTAVLTLVLLVVSAVVFYSTHSNSRESELVKAVKIELSKERAAAKSTAGSRPER